MLVFFCVRNAIEHVPSTEIFIFNMSYSTSSKTGNAEVITQAMVRKLPLMKNGNANGVIYIDKTTMTENRIKSK